MNKGKHFTRVCLDCGKVMENVAGNLRFCASCRRERHNQYCRDYRAHNEKPARVMWYTVWDAKTGDLLASGTSEMCARRLGYKSANSFASAVSHGLSGSHRTYKYTFSCKNLRFYGIIGVMGLSNSIIPCSSSVLAHRRAFFA